MQSSPSIKGLKSHQVAQRIPVPWLAACTTCGKLAVCTASRQRSMGLEKANRAFIDGFTQVEWSGYCPVHKALCYQSRSTDCACVCTAAQRDTTFGELLPVVWIRPATWLHFVCEISVPTYRSSQYSWWGLVLTEIHSAQWVTLHNT